MSESQIPNSINGNNPLFLQKDIQEWVKINSELEILIRFLDKTDIPLWIEFIKNCSTNSLYSRFQGSIVDLMNLGVEFCNTDFHTIITIGAEYYSNDDRELTAIAWIFIDEERKQAEFAILVSDKWQHKGLGTRVIEFCQKILPNYGIESVYGSTTLDNYETIMLLKKNNVPVTFSNLDNNLHFKIDLE